LRAQIAGWQQLPPGFSKIDRTAADQIV
jgi:hypothetical protein